MSRKTDTPFKESSPSTARERKMPVSKANKILRGAALSTALAFTFFASQPANAVNLKLGGVDIQIDTTMSLGASTLLADRETKYLPVSNVGPGETALYFSLGNATDNGSAGIKKGDLEDGDEGFADQDMVSATLFTACANPRVYNTFCQDLSHALGGTTPNFDGSINTDDGGLNFDADTEPNRRCRHGRSAKQRCHPIGARFDPSWRRKSWLSLGHSSLDGSCH